MKITQVCHRYYPDIGGVETHVQQISEGLSDRGCEVEVLTTDQTGTLPRVEEINNVTVRRFKSYAPQNSIYYSKALKKYLKENTFDIIHAHNYHALPALHALKARKRMMIFTPHYHGSSQSHIRNFLLSPYKLWGRSLFSEAEWVICVSDYEKELIKKDFKFCKKRLITIPNGINLDEFKNKKTRKPKTLLYVGRLEEYKGIQHILHALTQLPEHKLTIIGKGNYQQQLTDLSKKLGVDTQVAFHTGVGREQLVQAHQSASIFIMLSRFEAYGITTAEALAAGTPCIVAKNSALEEFIDNTNCIGVDLDKEVTRQLVDAIHELEGRKVQKPDNIIDWKDVTKKILSIYKGELKTLQQA